MNFLHIISILIFANLGFGRSPEIEASKSLFPQFMLSQYYISRTAGELSSDQLQNGEISIFRYGFRSFPEKIIKKFLEESDDVVDARNKLGYSLSEVIEIWDNASTEEDKRIARERIGKTPSETADYLSTLSSVNNNERNRILEVEQKLLKYDSQSEELEVFLIVPYSVSMVENIFSRFDKWPRLHSSYRESKVLTDDDFKSLPEKFHNLKSDENSWYHFYRSKILQFEWSGVNYFQRLEENIPTNSIYKNLTTTETTVKRVVLRWDLSDIFDGDQDDPWDDDDELENPFENNEIDVSSGYLLLEEYVDTSGVVDQSKTMILLKNQFRIGDLTLSDTKEISENLRTKTMSDFVSVFLSNLRKELETK